MRSILVLNPKGGSGKSTLAMNIAGYFADAGKKVALADCDPQSSSRDWLAVRPAEAAEIQAAKIIGGKVRLQSRPDILVSTSAKRVLIVKPGGDARAQMQVD